MIRVYAGNESLTEQVKGWLADTGFMFYKNNKTTKSLKRFRNVADQDVLVQVVTAGGDYYRAVMSPEQEGEVMEFVKVGGKKKK